MSEPNQELPPCVHCGGLQSLHLERCQDSVYESYVSCTFCEARGPLKMGMNRKKVTEGAVADYGVGAIVDTGQKRKRNFKRGLPPKRNHINPFPKKVEKST